MTTIRAEAALALRKVGLLWNQLDPPPEPDEIGWSEFKAEFDAATRRGDTHEARASIDRWYRKAADELIARGARMP